jgi:Ca2+/Na+ antiporter
MINSIHSYSGLISAWVCGVSGLVFLIMHFKIKQRNEILGSYLIISSVLTLLTNDLIVAYLYSLDKDLGSFHLFYVAIVLFTLTFLYIYKDQMRENYFLYWGLALLYLMGLAIRAITTFGEVLV